MLAGHRYVTKPTPYHPCFLFISFIFDSGPGFDSDKEAGVFFLFAPFKTQLMYRYVSSRAINVAEDSDTTL